MSSNTDQADAAGVASASDLEADSLLDDALDAMFVNSADDDACGGPSETADTTASRAAEQPAAPPPAYDPTDYQRPHPDDRDGGLTKTTKGKGKTSPPLDLCVWCKKPGAKLRCGQCKSAVYCGEICQREDWKRGGHKKACPANLLAATYQAKLLRESRVALDADQCLICLEPPRNPTSLPCGHMFCTTCVEELRDKGVSDVCPLCRAPLPPGAEKLFWLGYWVWQKFFRLGGMDAWVSLTETQQQEWDGAVLMLDEAMNQVRWGGLCGVSSALTRSLLAAPLQGTHRGCARTRPDIPQRPRRGGQREAGT